MTRYMCLLVTKHVSNRGIATFWTKVISYLAEEWDNKVKERLAKGLTHCVKKGNIKDKLGQDKAFWSQSTC